MMLGVLILGWVFAARAEGSAIKGVMFGEYYYILAADETDAKQPRKRNAFRFRRLYFTYQKDIATDFAIRFRLEAKDAWVCPRCEDGTLRQTRLLTVEEGARRCGCISRTFRDADLGGRRKGLGVPLDSQDRARLE